MVSDELGSPAARLSQRRRRQRSATPRQQAEHSRVTYKKFRLNFFFSSRRRHTRSVSAFLLNRSSDLGIPAEPEERFGIPAEPLFRSITHAYSIVIGSKHITLNATGGGFLTASKQFRHGATSKSRSNTASNSTKHKSPHLSGWRQIISLIT